MNQIPLVDLKAAHAEVADEVRAGFERVLADTAFIGGDEVRAFEREYADFGGVAHCVGVANGTDAVELALRASGVGPGDEVVIPANTFIATAGAVARIGAFLGYRVTVCDARPVFATARRFPEADEVVVDWPHRYLAAEAAAGRIDPRTVLCVLTHDPKFDVPVLEVALELPVAYVGAMGSRRTHDDRLKRLREDGVPDASLARLASPIGLDLGARTPEETAVSVAAEIVALRWGGSGTRLTDTDGPVHRDPELPG
jgi:xanthine dehydrogenase accessory factor